MAGFVDLEVTLRGGRWTRREAGQRLSFISMNSRSCSQSMRKTVRLAFRRRATSQDLLGVPAKNSRKPQKKVAGM